jgi:hypothetical protein
MDDDLRDRLSAIDPCPSAVPVHRVDGPHARALLEGIMSTPVDDRSANPGAAADPAAPVRRPRRWLPAALAGAAVAAAVTGVVAVGAINGKDAKPAAPPAAAPAAKTQLALKLPEGNSMASCVMFDVQILGQAPVAFGGTVSELTESSVTLDVDRWYRGGPADQVVLSIPSQQTSAALDGVDFVKGQRYLVTATEGTVNGCGFSGPATPEFEASFQQAFA